MAWVNVFSLGNCTLTVHKDGSATAMTAEEMTLAGVSVAADAAGLVTLTAPAIGSGGGSYEVRVAPSFNTNSAPVRVTGVEDTIAGDLLNAVWSPDPAGSSIDPAEGSHTFAPDQPWTYAGVLATRRAI